MTDWFSEEAKKSLTRRKALPSSTPKVRFISSGLYGADLATGGGFPRQRVTEVSGRGSTSKTTLSLVAAAKIIESGGYVALIETESTLDFKWMEILGIPQSQVYQGEEGKEIADYHLHVWHPVYLESALETLLTLYKEDKYDLIILDSFGASPVRAAAEGTMDDTVMMKRARVGSQFKEKFSAIGYNGQAAVVLNNQVYTNSNQPYYDKLKPEGGYVTSSGGESMVYLPALRIYMETPGKNENKDKVIVSKEHRGMIHKNKTGRSVPQRFKFDIVIEDQDKPFLHYPKDIWQTAEILGILEKRGHYWFYGEQNVASNDDALSDKVRNDNEFSKEIESKLIAVIGNLNEH